MFCFVNLRGCLRDLGDWTSVWFICSFGLPFSDNWWYFALCKVISQWFSMVAFSQTRALHHPNECLHWWECVESLRCVEVEKKKRLKAPCVGIYWGHASPWPKNAKMSAVSKVVVWPWLVPIFVQRWHVCFDIGGMEAYLDVGTKNSVSKGVMVAIRYQYSFLSLSDSAFSPLHSSSFLG